MEGQTQPIDLPTDDRWVYNDPDNSFARENAAIPTEPFEQPQNTGFGQSNSLWTPYDVQSQPWYANSMIGDVGLPTGSFGLQSADFLPQGWTTPAFPPSAYQAYQLPDSSFTLAQHQQEQIYGAPLTTQTFPTLTQYTHRPATSIREFPGSTSYNQASVQRNWQNPADSHVSSGEDSGSADFIRKLQKQLQDKDKELKLKDDIIRVLLQTQTDRPKIDVDRGKKRQRGSQAIVLDTTSDSEGNASDRAIIPAKRSRFDEDSRQQVAETRGHGACIRCRRLKKKCEPGESFNLPCEGCRKCGLQFLRIPCIRTHIVDITMFRTGTTENDTWTLRSEIYQLRDLTTYSSSSRRKLLLTHDWGPPMEVTVRPFLPIEGDETSYKWTSKDGTTHELPMPCYAIADLTETQFAIETYITSHLEPYMEAHLDSNDILLWNTFQLASQNAQWSKSPLLEKVLRMWMAARLIEKPWRIIGKETLDMKPVTNPDAPYFGWIPVTPIMDTQLDQIVIRSILCNLKSEVLQALQMKIEKCRKRDWMEIFLAIFVMLNTIELATAHDHHFASMYGHVSVSGGTRFEDYRLVESYFHGAQTLIAHFRDTLFAHLPFLQSKTQSKDVVTMGELNTNETDFFHKLRNYLKDGRKKMTLMDLKRQHSYETPLYWAHQLFAENWDGTPVTIQENPPVETGETGPEATD